MARQLVQDAGDTVEAGPVTDDDVQQPLMLVMPVTQGRVEELRTALKSLPIPPLNTALDKVGTVHSTRFVILEDDDGRWSRLVVVATYDGTVEDYIGAFARELSVQFNALFAYIADNPPLPVEENVDAFIEYVRRRDVKPANGQTYRAYPGLSALDIVEATRPSHDSAPSRPR